MAEIFMLPKNIQEELHELLGENKGTRSFINMVGHLLGEFNASPRATQLPKMNKRDADYKQIEKLRKKTKELHQAIKAMDDRAWLRVSSQSWISSSGPPSRERSFRDVLDLCFAAESALEQTLAHGEKGTISPADVARVSIIAFCFQRRGIKHKITAVEGSKFHDTVKIILDCYSSPKAIIRKLNI